MKAIVQNQYGSPDELELKEVTKPKPMSNEVLVKVRAASLNFGDFVLLKGKPYLSRLAFGLFKPNHNIPGGDVAGQVEAVGEDVQKFHPGDEVFGDLSHFSWGAFAEYVAVNEKALALKPANLSFEEAAAVPMAATTALQGLRDKGNIEYRKKVLINGASGGVGTFAVQIAKAYGAEVTGVCSTRNLNILKSLGADHMIDYTVKNFTKESNKYDLIVAVNGYHPILAYKRSLKPNGIYVMIGGSGSQMAQAIVLGPWISMTSKKKMVNLLQKPDQQDLIFIKKFIEEGKLKPIIDRNFTLDELPEAFKYFEKGNAQGKVVVTI
ncbi:NAD(P)-dependent alcohol dehydrogenase [Gracilibacillus suaedae]|uniref:NAD(P)-dependent alcohol dehydrogenase n=1 Tax=Gracilibacillus suaedae TaxID=2820273 RepID=UPI001ABDC372|nr:NAD(P)-dependent alcohol dehydrogenase [Gracilibacillus suaedae]